MSATIRAIRYRNLDEARRCVEQLDDPPSGDLFDDGGDEPQGLLSVIAEDLIGEERFYRLFDGTKGTLIEVERIAWSGFGPPAEEDDYMGFARGGYAYVLAGAVLPIGIIGCPAGANDIHQLEAQVLDGEHPLDREAVTAAFELGNDWDFEDLWELIRSGEVTAQQVDEVLHS